MGATRPRPAGADDFVKWRRSIDEHLELGLLTWDEYGMFNWLCTKADPRRGTLRTSWTVLAGQTRLGAKHVEKLCRGLKGKGYIDYPEHRGWRTLVHVGIDKFPVRDGTYTALPHHPGASPADVPAKVLGELAGQTPKKSTTSPAGRVRERSRSSLRVRSADASTGSGITDPSKPEERLGRTEALVAAPCALRETVELYWLKTGRDGLTPDDLAALRDLDQAHTPAVIQKAITEGVERFRRRGEDPHALTLRYVWDSLGRFTTRTTRATTPLVPERPAYPPGLTRLN
jgi:hypothetical protein